MTFLEAQQTARRLFGNTKLHRGKNRCFVLRNGLPIGDGKSWLEALRSAGELQMLMNATAEDEQKYTHDMIAAFREKHPDMPIDKLTEEQLAIFDVFVIEYEKENLPPPRIPTKKSSNIPEIPRIAAQPQKPLVTLK